MEMFELMATANKFNFLKSLTKDTYSDNKKDKKSCCKDEKCSCKSKGKR